MECERLVNQASARTPLYRRIVFKAFVISIATGTGPKTRGIFRRFADILSRAGVSSRKLCNPFSKNIKDSKKLPHAQWLKTKSGIGATLVVRISA